MLYNTNNGLWLVEIKGIKFTFLMRDNFRPNLRLTINIVMVVDTFLIAINLRSEGKQDKKFIKRGLIVQMYPV